MSRHLFVEKASVTEAIYYDGNNYNEAIDFVEGRTGKRVRIHEEKTGTVINSMPQYKNVLRIDDEISDCISPQEYVIYKVHSEGSFIVTRSEEYMKLRYEEITNDK